MSAGATPRRDSTARRTAAGQPPVSRCSSAATAGSAPVSSVSSVAISSTSNASCEPVISMTRPCPLSRSTGNGSSARDATTRCRRSGAWRQSASIAWFAPAAGAISWTSSTTRTRSRRSSLWRISQISAAKPRPRPASSSPLPGPAPAVTAFAASTGSAGTRSRRASATPRAKVASETSSDETVYQAQFRSLAQAARSVDLPKPAPATTLVSRRRWTSSRIARRRGRGRSGAGAPGGRSLKVAVVPAGGAGAAVPPPVAASTATAKR